MVKYITIGISEELHTKFKNHCTNKNVNMKDEAQLAIQVIIAKGEERQKQIKQDVKK